MADARTFEGPQKTQELQSGTPAPTDVQEGTVSPQSNAGRQEQARATMTAAIEQLLTGGKRVIGVDDLAGATGMSEVTIRRQLPFLPGRLRLRRIQQRRIVFLPKGG